MGLGSSFGRCADSQQSAADHTKVTQISKMCKILVGREVSVNELRMECGEISDWVFFPTT